jgi:hypothetical protein
MSIRFFDTFLNDLHNRGMSDRHQAPSYPLRLSVVLKEQVTKAAAASGRSFNAEVAHRLQVSFEAQPFEIPAFLKRAGESGATVAASGAVVLHLTITPGMTVEKVLELLEAAQMALPEGTQLVVDSARQG